MIVPQPKCRAGIRHQFGDAVDLHKTLQVFNRSVRLCVAVETGPAQQARNTGAVFSPAFMAKVQNTKILAEGYASAPGPSSIGATQGAGWRAAIYG